VSNGTGCTEMFKNNNQPVGEQPTAMALATVQQSKLCFASIVAVLSLGGGRF